MSIADLIRRMKEAGAPMEAILIAVEAIEVEQTKDADRRAKRAEQKRKERACRATVALQSHDMDATVATKVSPSLSPKEKSPPITPSKEITPISTPSKTREASPHEILSECMSEATARDLIAHRQKLRKPLTARAAKLLAKDFVAYGNPEEAAEMMIKNGWQGFHPTWVSNQAARAGPPANGRGGMASLLAKQLGLKDGRESRDTDEAVHVLPVHNGIERGNERDDGRQLSGDIIDLLAASSGRSM